MSNYYFQQLKIFSIRDQDGFIYFLKKKDSFKKYPKNKNL
jgi:hypothetical protein